MGGELGVYHTFLLTVGKLNCQICIIDIVSLVCFFNSVEMTICDTKTEINPY